MLNTSFLIAGAIMAMVNKEVLLSYLGTSASKLKSFPVAIFSSFLLAVLLLHGDTYC
jgi:uncharacterized membrane protein YraQ (UPF0718 family)